MIGALRRLADVYVAAVIWVVACTQLAFWAAVILSVSVVIPIRRLVPLVQFGAGAILRAAGIRLRVEGLENLPRDRPVVLMGNHVNLLDPFVVCAAFPVSIVGLERASHFRWPVYGWLVRRWGNIPVYPERPASARTTLKRAQEDLRQGLCVVVFPEGTRTRTGQMGQFRKGAFFIARQAGADVVPFTIRGSYARNQRGSLMIRPGPVEVIIGAPLPAAEWRDRPMAELMEATLAAIQRGMKDEEDHVHGDAERAPEH